MKLLFLAIQQLLLSKLTAYNVGHIRLWNNQLQNLADGKDETFSLPCLFIEFVSPMQIQQLGNGVQTYDPLYIKIHIIHDYYDAQDGTMAQNLVVLDMAESVYQAFQDWMPDVVTLNELQYQIPVGVMVRTEEEQDTDHTNLYHFIQTYQTNYIDNSMKRPVNGTVSVPPLDYTLVVNPSDTPPSTPVSVVVSSAASLIDGLYHATISFSEPVAGFTMSDITVTHGSNQYLTTDDNTTFKLMVMPDATADVTLNIAQGVCTSVSSSTPNSASNTLTTTIDPYWKILTNTSTSGIFLDLRESVGLNGDSMQATDPGLVDLSGNGHNATRSNNPLINWRTGSNGLTALRDLTSASLNTNTTGSTMFNRDFTVFGMIDTTDGQPSATFHLFGNKDAVNTGAILSVQTNGKVRVSNQAFIWDSTNVVFADGVSGIVKYDVHFDYTTDVLSVYVNDVLIAGSFTTSNISAVNPAAYNCTANLYVASLNSNGAIQSNPNSSSLYYFAVTNLQLANRVAINNYLQNKKPTLEFVTKIVDNTFLKVPHDIQIKNGVARVSCKGDTNLTTVDGSFANINLVPGDWRVLGGYAGHGDQQDGETVHILSDTRSLHFCNSKVLLLDTTNFAAPTKLATVAYSPGTINGVALSTDGKYLFGFNKGGYIDVFDVSDTNSPFLYGSKNTSLDNAIGPHDGFLIGDYACFCNRTTGIMFGCYKVFNNGVLITPSLWTLASSITTTSPISLDSANRLRVIGNVAVSHNFLGQNIVTIDVTSPQLVTAASILGQFSLAANTCHASAGAAIYRGKYDIIGNDVGLRILDITTDPANITQKAGYLNNADFTFGTLNTNAHDGEPFVAADPVTGVESNYFALTLANDNAVAIFKMNRI